MIAEALKLVQEQKKIDIIKACEKLLKKVVDEDFDTEYIHLTDSILERIELIENNLKAAKDILKKLKKREIFDFVKEYHRHYSIE